MKKLAIKSVLAVAVSILPVLLLYWQYKNDAVEAIHPFERRIANNILSEVSVTDLHYNSYYIAGMADHKIYLGNGSVPSSLFVVRDDTLEQSLLNDLIMPLHPNRMRVDSPFVYVKDLVSYNIFQANLEDLKIKQIPFDSIFFSEAIPLNSNSIIRRTFSNENREYIFTKESVVPEYTVRAYDLLEKQIDGLFCTDGMLHYDRATSQMIYVYFYRNQFLCMDTSMNLLFRGNTIDTISHARIKVARIESENSITLAGPPAIVNRRSYACQNRLFVNSSLMGKNEDPDEFNSSSVIDVYDLGREGKYIMSFYLPDYQGYKMKMFAASRNEFIAIHGRYLIRYNLDEDYIN